MTRHPIIALFAASFVLACANAAEAGFVAMSLEGDGLFSMQSLESGSGATEAEETPADPVPADENLRNALAAHTTGGMSSPTTGSHTNPVPTPALPAVAVDAGAQLISWLGPEGRVWLPPAFSSGVFRPPRA